MIPTKYLLVQHSNKYWNGNEAFYLNTDEELSNKLKEIADEQGFVFDDKDIIDDMCEAIRILELINVFEKTVFYNDGNQYSKICSNSKLIELLLKEKE